MITVLYHYLLKHSTAFRYVPIESTILSYALTVSIEFGNEKEPDMVKYCSKEDKDTLVYLGHSAEVLD